MWTCERVFWELLPAVRKYAAQRLRERGMSVPQIARTLGLTKAAVSQYLRGKRGGKLEPWMEEIVDRHLQTDCIDLVAIINEITHDPRFGEWKCG